MADTDLLVPEENHHYVGQNGIVPEERRSLGKLVLVQGDVDETLRHTT